MVEINNQRKAFLDMLAWSEGKSITDAGFRNHGYDVIVGGELFTDYSDHPQTCHAKPKLKSTGVDATSFFPCWWDAYRAAWPERLLSEKSGRCGIAADYERGALPMIDRGDIRQAI